jgi:hypothetical protein
MSGDIVLVSIERSEADKLVLAVREYAGKRYLDARVHFRGEDGEWRPTKKGVTFRRGELDRIAKGLEQAAAILREQSR